MLKWHGIRLKSGNISRLGLSYTVYLLDLGIYLHYTLCMVPMRWSSLLGVLASWYNLGRVAMDSIKTFEGEQATGLFGEVYT